MKELLQKVHESGWWAELIVLLLFVLTLNFVLKKILQKLELHFSKNQPLKKSAILALKSPLVTLIWFLAIVFVLHTIFVRMLDTPFLLSFPTLISIGFILTTAWFLMRWKRNVVHEIVSERHLNIFSYDITKIDAINKVATLLIFLITAFLLLEQMGTSMNSLIALGGIGGLAIAFASQQIISNFFGGIMIYFTQSFGVGDWIQLPEKNVDGYVEEIGWYTTQMRTQDKRALYIPNSLLANALVINPSRMTHRQFKSQVTLRYQDMKKIPKITSEIKELFKNNPGIDHTILPQIHFASFGDHGLGITMTAYAIGLDKNAFDDLVQELLYGIAAIVEKNDAQFATPLSSFSISKEMA